jgi:hypothetical protein
LIYEAETMKITITHARESTGALGRDRAYRDASHRAAEKLVAFLGTNTSERATRMRQSTPFVGVLSEPERTAIRLCAKECGNGGR